MKIDPEIKLDFSDVLIRPKRSELASRSEVSLERTFKFKNSPLTWTGVPIIVSNMDTTGTISMALSLQKHKMITCLHKYYTYSEIPFNSILTKSLPSLVMLSFRLIRPAAVSPGRLLFPNKA